MTELRFDNKVAIVTGAGGGLGKAYALLLASRGAKVVVNDLGGARDGAGKSSNFADAVVKEIKDKGGVAVADYNSVVEGDKIVKTAINNYGRVDILINNAGILRDRSFQKISDQDWDLIQAVHVKGAFKATQAAWEHFKKQKFGRVIITSSNAALYGNFGQANYSTAKMGLIGLANTLSVEGQKYNICVNTIVPTAASRLTEDILSPDLFNEMKPEHIAPVVAYMCHESFRDSGLVIDSSLGYASKVHLVRAFGTHLRKKYSDAVTIESVKENWNRVTDMGDAQHFDKITDATISLMSQIQFLKESSKNGHDSHWDTYSYTSKDAIIYALGVGCSITREGDLKYLYENHENFTLLPTYFVLTSAGIMLKSSLLQDSMPKGKEASFANILHGEQFLEIVDELPPTDASLTTCAYIADVIDKGSGTVVIINNEAYLNNKVVVRAQTSVFVVGQGNWGGPRTSNALIAPQPAPKRNPDAVIEQVTSYDQAALYRLSGDLNPLHIDPNMASASGYERPILHGLATLGFSVRHVLQQYGDNDPANFKSVKVRFAKPVLPGQTLMTEMWREGNRIHFQTRVKENNSVVINGAYVDLKNVGFSKASVNSVGALKSDAVFVRISDAVKNNPDTAKSINAVYIYQIMDAGKVIKKWTVDLKKGCVTEGGDTKGDVTMSVSDEDLIAIASGQLAPQAAFMKGKLKISGNIGLAQKLQPLLSVAAKL